MSDAAHPSLPELGARLFLVEREIADAERRAQELRGQILDRMGPLVLKANLIGDKRAVADAKHLEVAGAGTITYVAAGSSDRFDQKACLAKLEGLGARLRELGQPDVDDAAPYVSVPRVASLRVTPRL
jgi:hypothetical protein